MNQNILAGVAVVVIQGNNILLTLRKAGDNVGTFELPAGHIEDGEDPENTAVREVLEETGLVVGNLKVLATFGATCLFEAEIISGELINREPHAHESVEWYSLDNLPSPLGPSIKYYVENIL
jgi:8-oxo-dGTP diphosphatase